MIFNGFMITILCIAFLIVITGMLYVLRVMLVLYFEFDFIEKLREWVNGKRENDNL